MQLSKDIKEYSQKVCEQIRWKKAHALVTREIEDHLYDQRDAYIGEGEDEKTATKMAIDQMGEPEIVGVEFDKTYKPRPQWALITLTIMLMFIGIVGRYAIDPSLYDLTTGGIVAYIGMYVIAIGAFMVAYFLDFTILGKYPKGIYFTVLAVSVFMLLSSNPVNGASYFFISGGAISISLTYLAIIYPLVYALFIYSMRNKGVKGILFCGVGYIPLAVILMGANSGSGFITFTISALILLCTAIWKGWFGVNKKVGLMIVGIPTVIGGILLPLLVVINRPWQIHSLKAIINPSLDPQGAGYLPGFVRDVLEGANFIGAGTISPEYGEYANDMFYVIDLMITSLIHNFGWITLVVIGGVFIVFWGVGFYFILKQKSILGLMVSLSVMLTLITQTIVYMMSNLGLGLIAAMSLPLVSYGPTSLIVNLALIGFMLSVFRTGEVVKDGITPLENGNPLLKFEDGRLIFNFRGKVE